MSVLAGSKKESEEMKHYTNEEFWSAISIQDRSIIASRTEFGSNPDIFQSWYGIPPSRQDVYAKAIKPCDKVNMLTESDK